MSPLLMLWTVFTGAAAWKRRQLTEDCKNAAETGANLLHRVMTRLAQSGHTETVCYLSASLIGRPGQALSGYPPLQCRCHSRARASLRTRHQGPSIIGFDDEVEQSFGRPCRQCDCRFKRTNDLTSSIVPRGTSFHRWVELDLLLSHLILHSSQATATSLVHRNSVPSTHMRC